MTVFYVIQDHPVYVPCGQRSPLRPELAAALGVWWLSQLAACAAGCAGWRMSGDVAVLPRCTARASSQCCPGWVSRLACWCRPVSEDAASVPAAGATASDLACPRCCSGASLVRPTALQRVVEYSHTHWSRKCGRNDVLLCSSRVGRVKPSANSNRTRVAPSPRPTVVTAGVRPELPSLVLPGTS